MVNTNAFDKDLLLLFLEFELAPKINRVKFWIFVHLNNSDFVAFDM